MKESARFCDANAAALADQYKSVKADQVHACWSKFLPRSKGMVLDVGAGSGRDAAWLAANGHEVVAVEPSAKMRAEGAARHPAASIRQIDEALPDFKAVEALHFKFDRILLSGSWMHVIPGSDRKRAFRKLASLHKPGGKIDFSLRSLSGEIDHLGRLAGFLYVVHPGSRATIEFLWFQRKSRLT
ncbi:MAG: class I SAM-dependent methyltransferase [Verrucomicrobiae bacterium]|nr:class I SAM-dependent methyltransferase [Verrucomicrobiae bacterium]